MGEVKYHINKNHKVMICRATKRQCRYGGEVSHYSSMEEATREAERRASGEEGAEEIRKVSRRNGITATSQGPDEQIDEGTDEDNYSFMKSFQRIEEKFDKDYDGVPTRFFKSDLREGIIDEIKVAVTLTVLEKMDKPVSREEFIAELAQDYRSNHVRFSTILSSPSDAKMPLQKVQEFASELGIINVREVDDERAREAFKSDRVIVGEYDGRTIVINSRNAGKKIFRNYRFRRPNKVHEDLRKGWQEVDIRHLAGFARLKRLTGVNVPSIYLQNDNGHLSSRSDVSKAKNLTYEIANALEDKQLEGKNFIAQKAYINTSNRKIATAWMDKKNPKPSHVSAASGSRLTKYFRKIEIDNDVDLEQFKRFEDDYLEVVDKLPKIPVGQEPELRIRKLGKHKALGVYFPHRDVVGVDVHSSGSTVHELAHKYDLSVKDNASLRDDFREIISSYSRKIKLPEDTPASRLQYYTTPTEIFARGMEHYAYEELGIRNSLIDNSKFNNPEHEPFSDPVLREKVFSFMRKLYVEDA